VDETISQGRATHHEAWKTKERFEHHKPFSTTDSIKEELERLRAELAYKNKLIEFLEERETVKKKKNSESSGN
jgi:hypothetical protein